MVTLIRFIAAAGLVLPIALPAQAPSVRADSLFAAGSWTDAGDAYRALVQRDSSNGMAWFRLGASLEPQQRFAEAAAAYSRAGALGFQTVVSEYRAARSFSRANQTGSALTHLDKAAAIGFPRALVDSEPAFAPIRGRPDFVAIVNRAELARFPCRARHDFDFWAGTFDVSPWNQPGARAAGLAVNTLQFGGCVIVEQFSTTRPGGTQGMSMSFYDVNRHAWRMVWNDDANSSNDFEGQIENGVMRFTGWVLDPSGKKVMASNTIERISADTVRQTYALSTDEGKTWVVQQSGRWVRRAGQ